MVFSVAKGNFEVSSYKTLTKGNECSPKAFSCSIKVEFKPNDEIKSQLKVGDRICLVQAVCDKIELLKLEGFSVDSPVVSRKMNRDENKTAGFSERLTDSGWAIDQQIYCEPKKNSKDEQTDVCNADPRYVEQRSKPNIPYRDHSDFSKKNKIGYAQNYVHGHESLTSAILSDEPNAVYSFGKKTIPVGFQNFEVVAMLDKEDGKKEYIGSLCWGWEIKKTASDAQGTYTPDLLTMGIVVRDVPTDDFIQAAMAWNKMLISKGITSEIFRLP